MRIHDEKPNQAFTRQHASAPETAAEDAANAALRLPTKLAAGSHAVTEPAPQRAAAAPNICPVQRCSFRPGPPRPPFLSLHLGPFRYQARNLPPFCCARRRGCALAQERHSIVRGVCHDCSCLLVGGREVGAALLLDLADQAHVGELRVGAPLALLLRRPLRRCAARACDGSSRSTGARENALRSLVGARARARGRSRATGRPPPRQPANQQAAGRVGAGGAGGDGRPRAFHLRSLLLAQIP